MGLDIADRQLGGRSNAPFAVLLVVLEIAFLSARSGADKVFAIGIDRDLRRLSEACRRWSSKGIAFAAADAHQLPWSAARASPPAPACARVARTSHVVKRQPH